MTKLKLNISLSPRRETLLRSSVPFTPNSVNAQKFRYYCPLCMEFFESILTSKCCKNYICLKCAVEYLNTKTKKMSDDSNNNENNHDSNQYNSHSNNDENNSRNSHGNDNTSSNNNRNNNGNNIAEHNVNVAYSICPHCFTLGFDPQLVQREDAIRDYSREIARGIYVYTHIYIDRYTYACMMSDIFFLSVANGC